MGPWWKEPSFDVEAYGITGEKPAPFRDEKTEVVGSVSGRVDGLHSELAELENFAILSGINAVLGDGHGLAIETKPLSHRIFRGGHQFRWVRKVFGSPGMDYHRGVGKFRKKGAGSARVVQMNVG